MGGGIEAVVIAGIHAANEIYKKLDNSPFTDTL